MDYSLLIASVSLGLSVYLVYLEIRRRRGELHFSITSTRFVDANEDQSFVVLYLSFVNTSTIPKVLYRMDSELLEGYLLGEVHGELDFGLKLSQYRAFGIGGKGCVLPFDDTPSFPLDIEPLRSRTVAFPVIISPVRPSRYEGSEFRKKCIGYLVVFDHRKNILAKAPLEIPD